MNCLVCSKRAYSEYCVAHKPRKAIVTRKRPKKVSWKQADYHVWLEVVARPFLIERDGNYCSCCGRPAYDTEKLDIEHTDGVGSHPETKRNLSRMTLMCRFPCHRNKTDGVPCHVTITA